MTTNERIEQLERDLQELKQELQKQEEKPKLRILYESETTVEMQYGEYIVRSFGSENNCYTWVLNGEKVADVLPDDETLNLYEELKQRQKEEGMEVLYSDDFLTLVVCDGERYLRYWNNECKIYGWVLQNTKREKSFDFMINKEFLEQKYKRITE